MTDETAIEMFVGGLVLDPNTQAPVVVLKDEAGTVHLPIWIGIAEATAIASAIKQLNMSRPLTHDLIHDLFGHVGVEVRRVLITELRDSTYYAELVLSQGDKAIILDARPSDAIAIALRASAPIFVSDQVLEQAKITFAEVSAKEDSAETSQVDKEGEDDSDRDFRSISKDRWDELLNSLNPEDFKYKM